MDPLLEKIFEAVNSNWTALLLLIFAILSPPPIVKKIYKWMILKYEQRSNSAKIAKAKSSIVKYRYIRNMSKNIPYLAYISNNMKNRASFFSFAGLFQAMSFIFVFSIIYNDKYFYFFVWDISVKGIIMICFFISFWYCYYCFMVSNERSSEINYLIYWAHNVSQAKAFFYNDCRTHLKKTNLTDRQITLILSRFDRGTLFTKTGINCERLKQLENESK